MTKAHETLFQVYIRLADAKVHWNCYKNYRVSVACPELMKPAAILYSVQDSEENKTLVVVLKGVCPEIFNLQFFHDLNPSGPLKKQAKIFSNSSQNFRLR